jgi:hypothetical protein
MADVDPFFRNHFVLLGFGWLAFTFLTAPYWIYREFKRNPKEELPKWMGDARRRKIRLLVILYVATLVVLGALIFFATSD